MRLYSIYIMYTIKYMQKLTNGGDGIVDRKLPTVTVKRDVWLREIAQYNNRSIIAWRIVSDAISRPSSRLLEY